MVRPCLPKREPVMETGDWRSRLPLGSRQKIVYKITETLKKHLPFCGPAGLYDLRRIAARFEDKIFSNAVDQTDYLRRISMKMLTMEAIWQNRATSSSSSIPAVTHTLPLDPGYCMDSKPSLVKEEPVLNTCDWRTHLPPDSRRANANKIMETLKTNVPNVGLEGISELMKIATSFEDLIFNTALSQRDYCRKISFKMMKMEEGDYFRIPDSQCTWRYLQKPNSL